MQYQKKQSTTFHQHFDLLKLLLAGLVLILLVTGAAACSRAKESTTPAASAQTTAEPAAEPDRSSEVTKELLDSLPDLHEDNKYYDVVFSGGGAKGIALVGAVRALQERGVAYNRVIGTSAGTILALLVAAGFDADELEQAMLERSDDGSIVMASFLEVPESFDDDTVRDSITYDAFHDLIPPFMPDSTADKISLGLSQALLKMPLYRELFSFVEFGGVFSGDKASDWLAKQLEKKGEGLSQTTLAEFHERTQSDFTAVATDSTLGEMLILNHRTAPDLPVIEAARMSTAVPFVYQEVEWQPEWGTYMERDISGNNIVDGGLSSNLAIELVLSLEPEILEAMGGAPYRDRVIGLFLDGNMAWDGFEVEEVSQETPSRNPLIKHFNGVKARFMHILDTMLRSHDHFIANSHPTNVCHIPVKGYTTMDFKLSEEKMDMLIDAGEGAMAQCLIEMQERQRIRE